MKTLKIVNPPNKKNNEKIEININNLLELQNIILNIDNIEV